MKPPRVIILVRHGRSALPTRKSIASTALRSLARRYDAAAEPPHFDWLRTQSGFTTTQFVALWDAVIKTMLGGCAA